MARRAPTVSAPIGPAPMTMAVSPGRDARPGDAVQGHGQRFGQRGMAGRESLGETQHPGGTDEYVLGEGAVAVVGDEGCCGSRTGTACPPGSAGRSRTWARTPRRRVRRPTSLDVVAHGGDGPGPLVPGHRAGLEAPPVAQLVDVGAADAAVVHPHQHLSGARPGHGTVLHGDHAGGLVDRSRHHCRGGGQPTGRQRYALLQPGEAPGQVAQEDRALPGLRESGRARCRRCGRRRRRRPSSRGTRPGGTRTRGRARRGRKGRPGRRPGGAAPAPRGAGSGTGRSRRATPTSGPDAPWPGVRIDHVDGELLGPRVAVEPGADQRAVLGPGVAGIGGRVHAQNAEAAGLPRLDHGRSLGRRERRLADGEEGKDAGRPSWSGDRSRTSSTTTGERPAVSASCARAVAAWPSTPCTPAGPSA